MESSEREQPRMPFRVKNYFRVLGLIITTDSGNVYNKEHHWKQLKTINSGLGQIWQACGTLQWSCSVAAGLQVWARNGVFPVFSKVSLAIFGWTLESICHIPQNIHWNFEWKNTKFTDFRRINFFKKKTIKSFQPERRCRSSFIQIPLHLKVKIKVQALYISC